MGRRRRTVDREVRLLLRAVVAVALALLVINVVARSYLLLELSPRVSTLRTAARDLDRLHAGMVDEETGQRGYLATGSTLFLDPYHRAIPMVAAATRRLAADLPHGSLGDDLVALQQAQRRWTDGWSRQVPAFLHSGTGRLTAFMAAGKQLFDAYRAAHDRLDRHIEDEISAATHDEDTWLLWSGFVQGIVTLGVVVVAMLARRRITSRITRPVEALAGAVGRITAGDLTTPAEIAHGPDELVALGRDVDAMAAALQEQRSHAERRQDEATQRGERLATVLDAARDVAGSLSLRYVLQSVADAACNLGNDRVRIWLLDEEQVAALAFDSAAEGVGAAPQHPRAGPGVARRAMHRGRPAGPERTANGIGSTLAVPLVVGGRVVGALECLRDAGPDATPPELEVLEALAAHAAGAVVSAQLHEQTLEFAVTDALTGLPNRRAFDEEFADEVQRAQRYHRPLAVVSVDLDNFKRLNDRHGHAYGDLVLQQAGAALRAQVRGTDRVYRLGGEELAVMCPETSAAEAAVLGERLRVAVAASAGADAHPVTASFGVAELPTHARDAAGLLAAADRALYAAKHGGRDRVAVDQVPSTSDSSPMR